MVFIAVLSEYVAFSVKITFSGAPLLKKDDTSSLTRYSSSAVRTEK